MPTSSRPNQRPAPGPPAAAPAPAKTATAKSRALADVNEASFNYLKVLGQGSFGKVLMAEHKGSKDVFAVKVRGRGCRHGELRGTERGDSVVGPL